MNEGEAEMKINGVRLTVGQSILVRMAVDDFKVDWLGDDAHGRKMTENYKRLRSELLTLITSKGPQ